MDSIALSRARTLALTLTFLTALLYCAVAAAADLKYSHIDGATVRVFSYKGVAAKRLKASSGRAYVLAIPDAGHGSGLVVSRDGLVLTARHVIADAQILAVQLPGQERPLPARVVYVDEERDHAFLAIPGRYKAFVEIPLTSPKLAVRDTVYVVGYPLDASRNQPQSQQGIVSGLLADGSLQLGVALNPGNSGGPVVDPSEKLLGIAVARADPSAGAQGIGVAVPIEHILPGYKRALGSTKFQVARKDLDKDGARLQREAELLVALLTAEDADTSWRALSGERDAKANASIAAKWLAEERAPSADALSLVAAEHWNSAAVLIDRGESGEREVARARELARKAADMDAGIATRSPFVAFALEDNEPTDVAAKVPGAPAEEEGGEIDGKEGVSEAAFDRLMNSLETSKSLPMLRIGPTIGMMTPFQIIGIGVTAKMMFADLLSVNARYQYGLHDTNDDLRGSHLFEALGGIAISTWNGSTTAQLVVDVESGFSATIFRYVPGKIPTVHTLVAEAGVLSGPVNLVTPDPMVPGAFSSEIMHQIYIVEAGVRYTYFYQAASEYLANTARSTVELSAHLLAPPLGIPDDRNNADNDPIKRGAPGLKAEVAWGSAPLSWGLTELGAGYMFSGDWIYIRLGWTYLFY